MDIYCPKCGEPWEIDSLHEYAEEWQHLGVTFADVRSRFRREGCGAAFPSWRVTCEPADDGRADMARALFGVLGDDLDGVAAMMDDLSGGGF